jgi:hypothetical protein
VDSISSPSSIEEATLPKEWQKKYEVGVLFRPSSLMVSPNWKSTFCSSLRRLLCTEDKKDERDVCHYVEINVVCNFLCKLKHNNLPIPNSKRWL